MPNDLPTRTEPYLALTDDGDRLRARVITETMRLYHRAMGTGPAQADWEAFASFQGPKVGRAGPGTDPRQLVERPAHATHRLRLPRARQPRPLPGAVRTGPGRRLRLGELFVHPRTGRGAAGMTHPSGIDQGETMSQMRMFLIALAVVAAAIVLGVVAGILTLEYHLLDGTA